MTMRILFRLERKKLKYTDGAVGLDDETVGLEMMTMMVLMMDLETTTSSVNPDTDGDGYSDGERGFGLINVQLQRVIGFL